MARWKAAAPKQQTGAHFYLDIAKTGNLFHGYSGGIILKILSCQYACFSSLAALGYRNDNPGATRDDKQSTRQI